MKRVLPCLALGALVLCTPALARKSVLKNGSYEVANVETPTLPDQWISFSEAHQSNAFAFDGDFSGLTDNPAEAYVGLYQDTQTALAGNRVLMRCMAYQPTAHPLTGGMVAGMKLEFYPPEGVVLPPPEENLAFGPGSPVDEWTLVELSTVVPADVNLADIVMIAFENDPDGDDIGNNTNGPVYFDTVYVERGSQPGVNALQNASFEQGTGNPNGMIAFGWSEFAGPNSAARKSLQQFARQGLNVLRCQGDNTCGIVQRVPVVVGETLLIQAYVRQSSTAPFGVNDDTKAGVKVQWVAGAVPSPHIDVAPNSNPISGTTNIITPASARDTWLPLTIDYTLPAQAASRLRATVIRAFEPGSAEVYFDGFEMVFTNVFNGSDADGDNDEDVLDIAQLQRVYAGSDGGRGFGGLVFDHDEDSDVDGTDLNAILPNMTGPVAP